MKTFLSNLALFLISCLIILLPSIINGYPILFSDTGTYILSGLDPMVPVDRPVFYGLFLRVTSLSISLWGTVISQSILVILFIVFMFKYIFGSAYVFRNSMITVALLSATTSLAYFTNHIVPDIFAPLVIIGVVLIASRPGLPVWLLCILLLLLAFLNLVHLSNLLITTSLTVIAIIGGLIFIRKQWFRQRAKALLFLSVLTLSSWILLPTVNHLMGAGFVTSRAKNIFMMGSLLENGLMGGYLDETCGEKGYEICNYLDSLPEHAHIFLWEYYESPLYFGGCFEKGWENCWMEQDPKYGIIIDDFFSNPYYLWQFVRIGIRTSLRQVISYEVQPRRPEGKGTSVHWPVEKHFSGDYQRYISAKQQQNYLYFNSLSLSQKILVPVSFVFLVLFTLIPGIRKKIPLHWRIFTIGILLALIINAFVCATFSHLTPRYQSRVIWIIPMLALAYLGEYRSIRT
jgi:hypothetical protein